MRQSIHLMTVIGIFCMASSIATAQSEDLSTIVTGSNDFSLELHRRLAAKHTRNMVLSPYSVATAVGILYPGSRGDTAKEIATTLKLPVSSDKFASIHKQLVEQTIDGVDKKRPGELRISNGLWVDRTFPLIDEFQKIVRRDFHSEIQQVDFQNHIDATRKKINSWAQEQTNNRIRNLVQPSDVNESTRFVITNTVFLKKAWRRPFNPSLTEDQWFFGAEKAKVKMMEAHMIEPYYSGEKIKLLRIPYDDDGRLGLLVLLPDSGYELSDLEKDLSWDKLSNWLKKMSIHKVAVNLPRLTVDSRLHLRESFIEMGLRKPFTEQADFSGVSSSRGVQIHNVIHQVYFSMDEKGTEAAAATAVVAKTPIASTKVDSIPVGVFRADRPFLFMIHDSSTGLLLFTGRMARISD